MSVRQIFDFLHRHHHELTTVRRDIHQHPELGFQESRTADIVARTLSQLGYEVHTGVGKTGVVGVLYGKRDDDGRSIGLRADMDALPIREASGRPYESVHPGIMHACGHDGHTTILLGAAHYLAATRNFNGRVVLIFQPAEEGLGGAQAMLEDGLFERFHCDEIYALHNWPGFPAGKIGVNPGPMMAAADQFDVLIEGRGGHGAHAYQTIDPVVTAAHLITAFQTIVSRNVPGPEAAVLTVAAVQSGRLNAMNVIPDQANLTGTVRTFSSATQALIKQRMSKIAEGIGATFDARITLTYRHLFPATVNSSEQAAAVSRVARELFGDEQVISDFPPSMGSEDFSYMLAERPGAYFRLGQGGADDGRTLHNPRFDFNDDVIPAGAAMFVRLAEHRMPLSEPQVDTEHAVSSE